VGGTPASQQITAKVIPDNATNVEISWSSGDNTVVNVSQTGLVTATGVGSTNITVRVNTYSQEIPVSVRTLNPGKAMETIGIYCFEYVPLMVDFWKACGVNTLQFIDHGFFDNNRANIIIDMATNVKSAQDKGFKVYILVLSNIKNEHLDLFHPKDEVEMGNRLSKLREMAEACSMADGFTIFAADPGGIIDGMGESSVDDYAYMVRKFIETIRNAAPEAEINVNPWAISAFGTPYLSPFSTEFWLRESKMTKALLDMTDIINEDVNVELACHDYYRSLALKCYDDSLHYYPYFPLNSDIDALRTQGVKKIWGWPYFLLDEVDDGDGAGTGLQITTRYIYEIVKIYGDFGFNGVMGNYSNNGAYTCAQNTYALCRFAQDPSATPKMVLDEYASFVATEETCTILGDILRYIENYSSWHQKMPENRQLPDFATPFETPSEARVAFNNVIPREQGDAKLLGTPVQYLKLVEEKLTEISK
jgi:hypothetical protein